MIKFSKYRTAQYLNTKIEQNNSCNLLTLLSTLTIGIILIICCYLELQQVLNNTTRQLLKVNPLQRNRGYTIGAPKKRANFNPYALIKGSHSAADNIIPFLVCSWLSNNIYYLQREAAKYTANYKHVKTQASISTINHIHHYTWNNLPQRALQKDFLTQFGIQHPFAGYTINFIDRYRDDPAKRQLSTIVLQNRDTSHLLIVFMGTTSLKDGKVDVNYKAKASDTGVHGGIAGLVYDQHEQISAIIGSWKDFEYITLTGHSLGGALAIEEAYLLRSTNDLLSNELMQQRVQLDVITFGAPKVYKEEKLKSETDFFSQVVATKTKKGWFRHVHAQVSKYLMKNVNIIKFVHPQDPVPHLPPDWMGFKSVGIKIELPETLKSSGRRKAHDPETTYWPWLRSQVSQPSELENASFKL